MLFSPERNLPKGYGVVVVEERDFFLRAAFFFAAFFLTTAGTLVSLDFLTTGVSGAGALLFLTVGTDDVVGCSCAGGGGGVVPFLIVGT